MCVGSLSLCIYRIRTIIIIVLMCSNDYYIRHRGGSDDFTRAYVHRCIREKGGIETLKNIQVPQTTIWEDISSQMLKG